MNTNSKFKTTIILILTAVILAGMISAFGTETCFAAKGNDLSEYDGKTIALVSGAAFDTMIEENGSPKNVKFQYLKANADCIKAVTSGKADVYCTDEPIAALAVNRSHGSSKINEDVLCKDNYGFMFPKGSELTDKFSKIIRRFKKDGTFDKMKEKWMGADDSKKVVIKQDWEGKNGTIECWCGNDSEPMSYVEGDKIVGFSIDAVYAIARELDYKVNLTPVTIDAMVPAIASGKADMCASCISITEERKKKVDFAETYYNGAVVFVSKMDNEQTGIGFLESIKESFEGTFIISNRWKLFAGGVMDTLLITVLSIIFGTVLGFLAFMLCRKGNKAANKIVSFFSWLIHGMPEVVLLMILFYIVFAATSLNGLVVSIVAFTLTFAVAVIGLLKTGVNAVDKGQTEAAYALGHSDRASFFKIVLPQAAIHVLPGYKSEIVALIKATAIVGYIAVQDLTKVSDIVRARTYDAFFPLIATAIIYFIMAAVLTFIVSRVQVTIDPKHRKKEQILKGVKTND